MLLLDNLVRGVDDDLRARESRTRLVLVLPMTRQVGLIVERFGADFALKLAAGTGVHADAMTLQIESILEVLLADFAVKSELVVAMKVFGVSLEVVRRQEWFGAKSANVRRFSGYDTGVLLPVIIVCVSLQVVS